MLFHICNLTPVLTVEVTAQKPCPQVTTPNANPPAILKTPTFNVQSPQASNPNGITQTQAQAADPAVFQEFCMNNFNELKDAIQNMNTKKPQNAQIPNEFSECMQKLYKLTLPCKKCHACNDKGECNTSLIREIFTQTEGEVKNAKEFFTELKKNMFMFNQIKTKIFKIQQMIRCDPTDGCLTCDLLTHQNLTFIINYLAALYTGESFSMFDLMGGNSTGNASISGMMPFMCNFTNSTKKDNSNDTE